MNEKENVIENNGVEAIVKNTKEYQEERFEFALLINDNLICKRYFKIPNYIEDSMNTAEFKNLCDYLVFKIDEDLKSKSRVYTWYFFDENIEDENDEFRKELAEPWEYTFKFVIYDNKKEMYVRIWDGYGYPKYVRSQVDITNKYVKLQDKNERTFAYDKEVYYKNMGNKIPFDAYLQRSMIMDKEDLIKTILDSITETCSRNEGYSLRDFSLHEKFGDKEYCYSIKKSNDALISDLYKTFKPKSVKKK